MTLRAYFPELRKNEGEIIAGFGQARLVKTVDSKYELRGGSKEDRMQAYEWLSLFFHEAVVKEVSLLQHKGCALPQ